MSLIKSESSKKQYRQSNLFDAVAKMKAQKVRKKLSYVSPIVIEINSSDGSDNENSDLNNIDPEMADFELNPFRDKPSPKKTFSKMVVNKPVSKSFNLELVDSCDVILNDSITLTEENELNDSYKTIIYEEETDLKLTQSPNKKPKQELSNEKSTLLSNTTQKLESVNLLYLNLVKDLFQDLSKSEHNKKLLEFEPLVSKNFANLDVICQYVFLKLFTRKQKWQKISLFMKQIDLELSESEETEICQILQENNLVRTDYLKEELEDLLSILDKKEVQDLFKSFKFKNPSKKSKEEMIQILVSNCRTQSTLTVSKSTEDVLLNRIQEKLGACFKMTEEAYVSFSRVYFLATFAEPEYTKITDLFRDCIGNKIIFPTYKIQDVEIFTSRQHFLTYYRACNLFNEIIDYLALPKKDLLQVKAFADTAFFYLQQETSNSSTTEQRTNLAHLEQFTACRVYRSIMTVLSEKLMTKYFEDVKIWLEYLLEHYKTSKAAVKWYNQLSWLYMRYLTPKDYNKAGRIILEAYINLERTMSDIDCYNLELKAKQIKENRTNKIDPDLRSELDENIPDPINTVQFPSIEIDAKSIRSNQPGKRNYVLQDGVSVKFTSVEQVAINHFIEIGYTDGIHCEGGLITALFCLCFWDIIYETDIEGAFISKVQKMPLDFRFTSFYENRKDLIDARLKQIASDWSDLELFNFLNSNWEKYSNMHSITVVENIIESVEFLNTVITCFGRKILCDIFERLVKDCRAYMSGLPDLWIWDEELEISKFVEVKGEGDTLRPNQINWINYLMRIGADVEVCYVHTIGSKRRR